MTAQTARLPLQLVHSHATSHRRVCGAAVFGNSARMASTRTGGVAETLDRAFRSNASAFLVFTSSEEQ